MSEQQRDQRYWHTEISAISTDKVSIRGYDLEQLIGMPFAATAFLLLKGRLATPAETRVMDAILTAVLDYGLEKSGTAAARYVVSSNPSMQAGMATAALSAGVHSLAPEDTVRFIESTWSRFQASGSMDMEAFAESVVLEARRDKRRIPGFGHPVFRYVDPRAEVLRVIAVENGLWTPPVQLYEAVHKAFTKVPGREHFPINDVALIAALCVALGFTAEEATGLAILGTLPGVIAHVTEEMGSRNYVRVIPAGTVDYQVPTRDLAADLAAAGWVGGTR